MLPRPFLTILVYTVPVLVVAFGVLMGAESLASATGDTVATSVLRWAAMICLMALAGNIVLLVGALVIEAISRRTPPGNSDES